MRSQLVGDTADNLACLSHNGLHIATHFIGQLRFDEICICLSFPIDVSCKVAMTWHVCSPTRECWFGFFASSDAVLCERLGWFE